MSKIRGARDKTRGLTNAAVQRERSQVMAAFRQA
jgi:hypothetical protein